MSSNEFYGGAPPHQHPSNPKAVTTAKIRSSHNNTPTPQTHLPTPLRVPHTAPRRRHKANTSNTLPRRASTRLPTQSRGCKMVTAVTTTSTSNNSIRRTAISSTHRRDREVGPNGERGMGHTLMGGAAGAFVGSKLGLGKLGGAAAVRCGFGKCVGSQEREETSLVDRCWPEKEGKLGLGF
ncbi:hypothetical protein K440DRAFT_202889 [Wilcoxina mikolae CBS 423.85]|nr:hypothetical protein K440DRAFT_202889 [Wilcoxina mikolae CBS 423.85]